MIVYEVNLLVDSDVADTYKEWLCKHIREILEIPGFLSAEWFLGESETDRIAWAIAYRLEDQVAMDRYLEEFAPAMRSDGLQRFGGKFEATRRILTLVDAFDRNTSSD